MEFLSYLISGISLGSVYAIIALGYTMVYGIAKMLNFAHGDVIMVGGYVSLMAVSSWGLPAWAAVLVAMVVCTVLGVIIEGLAYKPLRAAFQQGGFPICKNPLNPKRSFASTTCPAWAGAALR